MKNYSYESLKNRYKSLYKDVFQTLVYLIEENESDGVIELPKYTQVNGGRNGFVYIYTLELNYDTQNNPYICIWGSTPFELTCDSSGSLNISEIIKIIQLLEDMKYYR